MQCPNCSKQISDDSEFCPECGQAVKPKKAGMPVWAWVLIAVVAVGVIIGIIAAAAGGDDESPDDTEEQVATEAPDGDGGSGVDIEALVNGCFDGDLDSCQTLFDESEVDSVEELIGACGIEIWEACDELYESSPEDTIEWEFGATCGYRVDTELTCVEEYS
jgi:predicted nucleic acid-binding Zn ribbon protein